MLAVIEHQQQLPRSQRLYKCRCRRLTVVLGDAEGRREGRGHQIRLRERRQIDEADPIGVRILNFMSKLQRKPRLANTTGAD